MPAHEEMKALAAPGSAVVGDTSAASKSKKMKYELLGHEPGAKPPTAAKVVLNLGLATTAVIVLILIIGFTLGELQIGGELLVSATDRPPPPSPPTTPPPSHAIAIHGGAGTIDREAMSPELEANYRALLNHSTEAGWSVLVQGGTAVAAVAAAVSVMEDSPLFNAGKGSVFSAERINEMDAAIMDGSSGAACALTGLTSTRNPIQCAAELLGEQDVVMLAGDGANRFCADAGMTQVEPDYFFTDRRWEALARHIDRLPLLSGDEQHGGASQVGGRRNRRLMEGDRQHSFTVDLMRYGTVGAVARDKAGHLAAATSTGGTNGKRHGRVGDTPVIGAGTWAKDATCAISATGHGESFIQEAAAHSVSALMQYARTSMDAALAMVTQALEHREVDFYQGAGAGGLIGVGHDGQVKFAYTSRGMYRAWRSSNGTTGVHIWES